MEHNLRIAENNLIRIFSKMVSPIRELRVKTETWGFPPASLGAPAPQFLKNNFQWSQPPSQFWAVLNTLFS